jgi:hypothetical protein
LHKKTVGRISITGEAINATEAILSGARAMPEAIREDTPMSPNAGISDMHCEMRVIKLQGGLRVKRCGHLEQQLIMNSALQPLIFQDAAKPTFNHLFW